MNTFRQKLCLLQMQMVLTPLLSTGSPDLPDFSMASSELGPAMFPARSAVVVESCCTLNAWSGSNLLPAPALPHTDCAGHFYVTAISYADI